MPKIDKCPRDHTRTAHKKIVAQCCKQCFSIRPGVLVSPTGAVQLRCHQVFGAGGCLQRSWAAHRELCLPGLQWMHLCLWANIKWCAIPSISLKFVPCVIKPGRGRAVHAILRGWTHGTARRGAGQICQVFFFLLEKSLFWQFFWLGRKFVFYYGIFVGKNQPKSTWKLTISHSSEPSSKQNLR